MKMGQATGLQVAFIAYGVMLLAVPLARALVQGAALEGWLRLLVVKGAHFFLAGLLILAIAPVRRSVAEMLRASVPRSMRAEVAAVGILKLVAAFGGIAALALWFRTEYGAGWAARMAVDADREIANAFSGPGLVFLLLSSTIGPFVEEVVFRGFIFRAFERQWGWVVSLLATSALFGIYHAHFWSAFTGSVILVCLLRRTGSLRGLILVHMLFNFLLWPPLLGQYAFPAGTLTEPSTWVFHGACLGFALIAVPVYVYMSRDQRIAPTMFLEPNGAFQK